MWENKNSRFELIIFGKTIKTHAVGKCIIGWRRLTYYKLKKIRTKNESNLEFPVAIKSNTQEQNNPLFIVLFLHLCYFLQSEVKNHHTWLNIILM